MSKQRGSVSVQLSATGILLVVIIGLIWGWVAALVVLLVLLVIGAVT